MERRTISGFMLTFLLMSVLTVASTVQLAGTLMLVAETTVVVDPPVVSANPGEYFTLDINVADVTDLYGWGFKLTWPVGLLEVDVENITEGSFLRQGGPTALAKKAFETYIDVGCTLLGAIPGVSGSGTLASATFQVQRAGDATLDLYDVSLIDSNLQVIGDWQDKDSPDDGYLYTTFPVARYMYQPHPTEYPGHPLVNETITFNATESYDPDDPYDPTPGGIVSYTWDFDDGNITTVTDPIVTHTYNETGSYHVILNVTDDDGEAYSINRPVIGTSVLVQHHDIAVINVKVTPTRIASGTNVTIKVTVLNNGSDPETLNVTAYANTHPITTELFVYWMSPHFPEETSLNPGDNATTTIYWDTAGVPAGSYRISVEAFLVKLIGGKWQSVPDLEREEDLHDNVFVGGAISIIETPQVPISVYTDKYRYQVYETMHLGLNVTNPLDRAITVCVAVWLEMRDGSTILVLHAHAVTLPASFTYSNPDFATFMFSGPGGVHTWYAALLNPTTHATLVGDTALWLLGLH